MLRVLLRNWIRVRWRARGRPRPVLIAHRLTLRVLLFAGVAVVVHLVVTFYFVTNPPAAAGLLPALLPGAGFLMILAGTSRALSRLYLDEELELLLVAPLKQGTLFAFNLSRMALATMALMGLLQLAALVGYGTGMRAPIGFYVAAVVITVVMAVMSSAISLPFMMLVARLVPARRLRTVIAALGPLQGLALFAVTQAGNPDVARQVGRAGDEMRRNRGLARLPTTWAANALDALRLSDFWTFVTNFVWLGGTTIACVAVAWAIYRRSFVEGLDRLRDASPRGRTRIRRWPTGTRLLPQSVRPIPIKDWRSLQRDSGALISLMMPLAMIVFVVLSSDGRSPAGGSLIPYLMFSATVPATAAFSREGSAFALLREAPLSTQRLLGSKYVSNLLPPLMIVTLAVAVIGRLNGMDGRSFVWAVVASTAVICILVAVHVSLAARQLGHGRRGARAAAGGVLLVLALDVLLAGPTALLIGSMAGSGVIPASLQSPAVTLVLLGLEIVSLAGLALLLANAVRCIDRWEPYG